MLQKKMTKFLANPKTYVKPLIVITIYFKLSNFNVIYKPYSYISDLLLFCHCWHRGTLVKAINFLPVSVWLILCLPEWRSLLTGFWISYKGNQSVYWWINVSVGDGYFGVSHAEFGVSHLAELCSGSLLNETITS